MSIGNTQKYLDWTAMQAEQDERDWQELNSFMTRAEREDYARWLDSLPSSRNDDNNGSKT